MAQESKTLIVQRFSDCEAVTIAIAPGVHCRDVLEAIGERGALGLATGPGPGLMILLADATVWNWVASDQACHVVRW